MIVVPLAGTWIETVAYAAGANNNAKVVPHAGTWIETYNIGDVTYDDGSFPSRERGLKRVGENARSIHMNVVPLAGTWIETYAVDTSKYTEGVVPLAGTWIETDILVHVTPISKSRSPRGNVD